MNQYSRHSPTVVHCRSDRTHTNTHTSTFNLFYKWQNNLNLSLSGLCVYLVYAQCWCWAHRHLHSHWSFDLPDWEGKYCGRVRHRPWSAHAPAPYGADRGRTQKHPLWFLSRVWLYMLFEIISTLKLSKHLYLLSFAGSVCVLKPVRHGHNQGKNWNQCGSNLPKHCCTLYLRERRTQKRLSQKQLPQCIGQKNCCGLLLLSVLVARNWADFYKGKAFNRLCCIYFYTCLALVKNLVASWN